MTYVKTLQLESTPGSPRVEIYDLGEGSYEIRRFSVGTSETPFISRSASKLSRVEELAKEWLDGVTVLHG